MTSVATPVAPSDITTEITIGELVVARPVLARVFERLGIDYCCGGKQSLAVAAARRGLDPATVIALLIAASDALAAAAPEIDVAAMSLTQLADHIENTHHAYLKNEIPRLMEMADRVSTKHAWRDGRLPGVAAAMRDLGQEMLCHMQKEEGVLFPLVRQIEANAEVGLSAAELAAPIAQMEAEHESAGRLTQALRELTDNFTPNGEACNTHRALLAGLAQFEADLHRHVHKENNVLFPRALALAAGSR